MGKTKKEYARSKKWTKRICLTNKKYLMIEELKKKLKYKTLAGTLDALLSDKLKKCSNLEIIKKKQLEKD